MILLRSFYLRPTLEVARALLGQTLVRETPEGRISGRIVETEAYIGEADQASHARAGRTARTEVMYGEAGAAYIYLTYGMYWMLNVVTEPVGSPAAVLIRAVEPLEGSDLMLEHRRRGTAFHRVKRTPSESHLRRHLTTGPARLCLAFAVTGELNRHDLTAPPLYLEKGTPVPDSEVLSSPRIGVAYAGAWAARPWRFHVAGSPWVSATPARERSGDDLR